MNTSECGHDRHYIANDGIRRGVGGASQPGHPAGWPEECPEAVSDPDRAVHHIRIKKRARSTKRSAA
jgi:hypothetical protein